MSRKLGLVIFNLVVQMDNPNIAEAWKDRKRPNSKKAAELLKEFPGVFDSIGCLLQECTINTDPKVPPVVHSPQSPSITEGQIQN